MYRNKIISPEEAVRVILDNDTLATGGFGGNCFPEELAIALEKRYLKTGSPRNLTLVYAAGQGDYKSKGLNHFAHEGLLKRVIGGHWAPAPALGQLAFENKIEAYSFPLGTITQLY